MRKLMWFTLGFAAACALGVYCDLGNWLLLLCLAFGLLILFTLCFSSENAKYPRVILMGCMAASVWVWGYHTAYLNPARNVDSQPQQIAVTVCDYSTATDYGCVTEGRIRLEGRTYRARVYLNRDTELSPGDVLEGEFRLASSVGGRERDEHYASDGVFLLAYEKGEAAITRADSNGLRYFPARLKKTVLILLDAVFPEDTVSFARALLLGDRSLLDYETNTALCLSGIRHVVAVSGLHVSILLSVLFGVFGYRRFLTPVIGWAVLLLFAALTGFTPSVVRSCIMYSLMLGSLMLQKEYDPPTALSFAVLFMLICNPVAVSSVGLQLSAGCLVGIFLFSEKIKQFLLKRKWMRGASSKTRLGRMKSGIATSVSVTLGTWITTTPLCAAYFGTVSLVGIVTNLLTLWLITVIFCGLLAVCVLAAVWLPAGQMGAWLLSWPIRLVLLVAKVLSEFPLAAVYTCSDYIVWWLVLCYTLLLVFMLSKEKRALLMLGCMAAGLGCAVAVCWSEPKLDDWRMSVLDVGQGQCIYINSADRHYLVDCGSSSDVIAADTAAEYLLSQGITELDGIILTHGDTDHAGGVCNLLKRVDADKIYLPQTMQEQNALTDILREYPERIEWVEAQAVTRLEDIPVTLITGEAGKSVNESGLCVLFQPENYDILITGDRNTPGERALLAQIDLPKLEVLVAGHHGSKSATGLELLTAGAPDAVIISVGENNTYGHPSQEVLERLELFQATVLRTDLHGTITIRG